MADVEVLSAEQSGGRVSTLQVKFKNAAPRSIDRDTAVAWLRDGHSLIPVAGHGHDVVRGASVLLAEVGEELFLRTDTKAEAADHIHFPGHH